jgi:hypothetical protein
VGVLLVAPIILQALPSSVGQPILRYMPFTISDAMTSPTTHATSAFSPWVGFAVLVVYALVALGVGGWLLVRRDA